MVIRYGSVLPGIARESAALARRRLGEIVQPTDADVQGLIDLQSVLTDLLRRSWKDTLDTMNRGFEATALRALLEQLQEGADTLLDIGASLRKEVGQEQSSRDNLEASEATLHMLRAEATKILDWLAKPWPPIDKERLARGIAQGERGEVIDAEDFLAELRAGEGS